jgi:sulfite reductase (NADPH) flavoprotein alpha-component
METEMKEGTDEHPHTVPSTAAGPFSREQARLLEELLTDLPSEQILWLSGYLAGRAATPAIIERRPPTGGKQRLGEPSGQGQQPPPPPQLTVLFGTETGNAEELAALLVQQAADGGLRARAINMADYRTKDLRGEKYLALITATHGQGDPPEPAAGFFEFVSSRKAPALADTRFAVLALGDSSYVKFCQAGQALDERFEELGAERLLARVECDLDYAETARSWVKQVVAVVDRDQGPPEAASYGGAGSGTPHRVATMHDGPGRPIHSRDNPYVAEVLESVRLTGRHSDKETRHIELRLDDGALEFEAGDSLGVVPVNEEAVVGAVVDALKAAPAHTVTVAGRELLLADALRGGLELTLLTPGFLAAYAEVAQAGELRALLGAGDRTNLLHFMRCNQVPDILERYPVVGLDPQTFIDMLRPLQPRLYSIASSPKYQPDQVDLAVAVTRTTPDGKARNGVASTYLAERRVPGETVPVYVDRNSAFRIPDDPDAAIIMVGAGTGVAPFRAFLQEREETGASGRSWLFFGERRFDEDFLYQIEWQRLLRDGILTRMDVAFSRDQAEKTYVQHRLQKQGADIYRWLEEGAHLYVCGDATGMAPAVHQALVDILRKHGALPVEGAEEYLRQMRADRRLQRDVY